jgi:hypothetical protein
VVERPRPENHPSPASPHAPQTSLQDIATAGVDALGEAWGKLTKEQRAMIGQAGLAALKAEAEKADAELVEPEDAPSIIDRIDRDIERREAAGCA